MASFISTLSLFLLVLATGYLTFPLDNELLQTSTMLSSNLDLTSEQPLVPRELSMNQIEQTTESLADLQTSTSTGDLSESASRDTRAWNEMSTLSPEMLTTVESTTENDQDATTEDYTTVGSQSNMSNDKREVSLDLTTDTSSFTSTSSSAVTTEGNLLPTSTNSIVNAELTTERSTSAKPSKKYTGLLNDKKDQGEDLEQEKKDKDDEEKKPIKPSKINIKIKDTDKDQSDDEQKEKPRKTYKKQGEDGQEQSDDEQKEKSNKTNKKQKEDDKEESDDDSKKSSAPVAQLDSDGMKNVVNYQKEYMDLDENSTYSVTQSGSTDSKITLKYKKGKKPLNEGEESATTKEEESNQ